ncbi:MAG: phospholipase D-like domain-containing protein [Lachnospiraceae bacterium]
MGQLKMIYQIIIVLLIMIVIYILVVTLSYRKHKDVSEKLKASFSPGDCYGEAPGSERTAYITDNYEAMLYRLQMIAQADKEIRLSTFEIYDDDIGRDLMSALLLAAERGVRVTVMTDGINAFMELRGSNWFQAFASHKNVTLLVYNQVNLLHPRRLQASLHDKYMIIDEQMYLLGGRNSNTLFLGDYKTRHNTDRELFVYLSEPNGDSSLNQLKEYFKTIIALPGNAVFQCKVYTDQIKTCYQELLGREVHLKATYPLAYAEPDWERKTVETNKITLLSNPIEPTNKEPQIWYMLHQLMLTGEEITIHTPYIICGKEMYQDLNLLCKETKVVKIITNDPANGANPWGCTDYLNHKRQIRETGAQIYEYSSESSLHSKLIRIDDRISVVGSYNLDMRSTYIDTELMLVVDSKPLNAILTAEEEDTISYCRTMIEGGRIIEGENYDCKVIRGSKRIMYVLLRAVVIVLRRFL